MGGVSVTEGRGVKVRGSGAVRVREGEVEME
jgi:hypothetical protein